MVDLGRLAADFVALSDKDVVELYERAVEQMEGSIYDSVERRAHWTALVERNVPNIDVKNHKQVRETVDLILEQEREDQEGQFWHNANRLEHEYERVDHTDTFWHAASTVMGRLPECNCNPCIEERWRPK